MYRAIQKVRDLLEEVVFNPCHDDMSTYWLNAVTEAHTVINDILHGDKGLVTIHDEIAVLDGPIYTCTEEWEQWLLEYVDALTEVLKNC